MDSAVIRSRRAGPANPGPPPSESYNTPRNRAEWLSALLRYCEYNSLPLPLAGRQMEIFCYNDQQFRVLNLPGRTVQFVYGVITGTQVHSQRPSYINALLIQSRGLPLITPCEACRQTQRRPFPAYVRAPGHFGGACGNCKWRDAAIRCTVRDSSERSTRQTRPWPTSPTPRLPPLSSTPATSDTVVDLTMDIVDLTVNDGAGSILRLVDYDLAELYEVDEPESSLIVPGGKLPASGSLYEGWAEEIVREVEQLYTQNLSTIEHTIQAGQDNDANLWLRRTQWPVYLQGILVPPLLQSLETPTPDAIEDEATVRVIWEVMGSTAAVSQRVTKQCGHFARVEAARTEQHESPFTPLLAYMDEANI
ncbi:hypothetical protein N7524_011689 [Penicillium chrysogenum]|nr:hypothetical protein N7524_011689 [Penicillium chrysogenum]